MYICIYERIVKYRKFRYKTQFSVSNMQSALFAWCMNRQLKFAPKLIYVQINVQVNALKPIKPRKYTVLDTSLAIVRYLFGITYSSFNINMFFSFFWRVPPCLEF